MRQLPHRYAAAGVVPSTVPIHPVDAATEMEAGAVLPTLCTAHWSTATVLRARVVTAMVEEAMEDADMAAATCTVPRVQRPENNPRNRDTATCLLLPAWISHAVEAVVVADEDEDAADPIVDEEVTRAVTQLGATQLRARCPQGFVISILMTLTMAYDSYYA